MAIQSRTIENVQAVERLEGTAAFFAVLLGAGLAAALALTGAVFALAGVAFGLAGAASGFAGAALAFAGAASALVAAVLGLAGAASSFAGAAAWLSARRCRAAFPAWPCVNAKSMMRGQISARNRDPLKTP